MRNPEEEDEEEEEDYVYFPYPHLGGMYAEAPRHMLHTIEIIRGHFADPINTLVGANVCCVGLRQDCYKRWHYDLELGRSCMLTPTARSLVQHLRKSYRTIRRALTRGPPHYAMEPR